jgi:hypothetical protein
MRVEQCAVLLIDRDVQAGVHLDSAQSLIGENSLANGNMIKGKI